MTTGRIDRCFRDAAAVSSEESRRGFRIHFVPVAALWERRFPQVFQPRRSQTAATMNLETASSERQVTHLAATCGQLSKLIVLCLLLASCLAASAQRNTPPPKSSPAKGRATPAAPSKSIEALT